MPSRGDGPLRTTITPPSGGRQAYKPLEGGMQSPLKGDTAFRVEKDTGHLSLEGHCSLLLEVGVV